MADVTTPLLKIPPSYLYMEYADDTDLQCYREAFNEYAQEYLDWFNTVCLGDYRSTDITGAFLDWIAEGIYGLKRVPLSTSNVTILGGYATVPFADLSYAGLSIDDQSTSAVMSDDIFKRTMTWNLYEGDGFQFTTTWLKRRIMRFLTGTNGNDGPFSDTYDVSVIWTARYTATVSLTIPTTWNPVAVILALCISNEVLNLPLGYSLTIKILPPLDGKNDFGWDIA